MTVTGSTICSLIQTFPVLLILAQNHKRCLETPLIYKPPTPTHSPEYYEALEALYHSLFGHGYQDHDHTLPHHGHTLSYHGHDTTYPDYGHAYGTYGTKYPNLGTSSYNSYPQVSDAHHSFPNYYNVKKLYNVTSGHGQKGYAPNQVYNVHNKYKVVVRKNKGRRHKLRSQKIKADSCQTVDSEAGSCITVLQCPRYMQLLQLARGNATVTQQLKKAHCGFEGKVPKVCCPLSTTTNSTTPAPDDPSPIRRDMGDYVISLPEPPVCGVSNGSFGKVVGGEDAALGDFPWMALLGYKFRRGPGAQWLCGGSLVTNKHVLTAAHCIYGHEDDLFIVRLGELNLEKEDDGATPVDIPIKTKFMHEEYSPNKLDFDIGIILLEKEVTFTDLIRPICIPINRQERSQTFENYQPIVAGWGLTKFEGVPAAHLQAVQVPVVSNAACAQAYARDPAQRITAQLLCAGRARGGKDACRGDSGGPLMQPLMTEDFRSAFYQIGVVSYGRRCGEAGSPGVYTRVTHFIPWIEEKLLGTIESLN